jgi:signal peptidase II
MIAPIFIFLLIIILDQFTKWYAYFFSWHVINKGFAWSLGQNLSPYLLIFLVLIILGYIFKTLVYSWKNNKKIAELIIFAGGFSNLLDRLFLFGVIDFIGINLIIGNYEISSPIFNIADIAITLGIIWIILREFGIKFLCHVQQSDQ